MAKSIKLLVYPVKDIGKAKTFYSEFLGVEPYVESPYYVGYRIGDLEVGLDPAVIFSYMSFHFFERNREFYF